MNIKFLEQLLDSKIYISFLKNLVNLQHTVPEVSDWLSWYNNDKDRLAEILEKIAKILLDKHYEVVYPIEMIIVPAFPFSKRPMISWSTLQNKSFDDYEVNQIKYYCSKLGNLINTLFICKNFVVIDIDAKVEKIRNLADVETRRGFHIIRYIPNYEAIEFNLGNIQGTKIVLTRDNIQLDIRSGKSFIVMYPLQARYLEFSNGLINVRSYKILSKEAFYAFKSGDITPLKATIDEVRELIQEVLERLGFDEEAKKIQLRPIERQEVTQLHDSEKGVPRKLSRYNVNFYHKIPTLRFDEFKRFVEEKKDILPVCLVKSLLENIPKGVRFFHGQFLRAILPHFVYIDDEELKKILDDWISRVGVRPSDYTRSKYLWHYFTGKLKIDDVEVKAPPFMRIPSETWTTFQTMGYCDKCPLRLSCLTLDEKGRKRLIVEYVEKILEVYLSK